MKSFALIILFVGACAAETYRATREANEIVIVRSENENNGDGTFRWLSELSDGTKIEQSGQLKDGPDPEHPIQVIQGSYSYTSPEGQVISLKYIADENGFQPEGDHLPTPPPADTQAAASHVAPQYQRPEPIHGRQQPRRF